MGTHADAGVKKKKKKKEAIPMQTRASLKIQMRFFGDFCHPAKKRFNRRKDERRPQKAFRSYQTGDEGVVKAHPRSRPSVNIIKPPR